MLRTSLGRFSVARLLSRQLERAGFSPEGAARVAGLPPSTVRRWGSGETTPGRTSSNPGAFWTLIEKCGLDPGPFLRLIPRDAQTKGRVKLTCQECGRIRWPYPSELRNKRRRVNVDWVKREAVGLCHRCAARKALRSEARVRAFFRRSYSQPSKARLVRAAATSGEKWARTEVRNLIGPNAPPSKDTSQIRMMAQAPRPGRSMKFLLAALAGGEGRAVRKRPLALCPLCALLTEEPRYKL